MIEASEPKGPKEIDLAFEKFLNRICTYSITFAIKQGFNKEDAEDAALELCAQYIERYRQGKLKGPLPDEYWELDLMSLCRKISKSPRANKRANKDSIGRKDSLGNAEPTMPKKARQALLEKARMRFLTPTQAR